MYRRKRERERENVLFKIFRILLLLLKICVIEYQLFTYFLILLCKFQYYYYFSTIMKRSNLKYNLILFFHNYIENRRMLKLFL